MKRIAIAMLLALTAFGAMAQTQGRGRPWRRGPLTAGDFGAVPYGVAEKSHLEYGIVYSASGVTEGMDSYRYCRTSALMYPTASWLVDDSATENELNYNQMMFDLVEVHRRQMQLEAMMLSNRLQYSRLLNLTTEQLDREMQQLQIATDYGRDSAAVERVRRRNREWLNAHPGERPQFASRLPWWSASMLFGVAVPTGPVGRYWSASVVTSGLDLGVGWGRHGLYYRVSGGDVRLIDSAALADNYLTTNIYTELNFGYGFTLFDRPRWSLTPYIAFGAAEYGWWYGETYTLGVTGRYHAHRWHRITNAVKGKAKCVTVSLAGNLFVSYLNMGAGDNSLSLGLQIGASFVSRKEHVEW